MADGVTHQRYLRLFWAIILPVGVMLFFTSGLNLLYPVFLYLNFLFCEFLDPDADHMALTKSEGDVLRTTKKLHIGLLGAFFIAYWFIYAYMISKVGGHRSRFSHGWIIGTIGRIVWSNIPLALILSYLVSYSIANWGMLPWSVVGWGYYWMDIWVKPYLVTQLVAWLIGDSSHLLLDAKWAKGRLYGFKKYGDKRSRFLKIITAMVKGANK